MGPVPTTRYARSGDLNIAYQAIGGGPRDLVYVPGWASNIDVMWEEPGTAAFLSSLASFTRLIVFDKRGTGMSDPVPIDRLPTLEERMDDVRAVMDEVGSERATLLGHSEGGNMCILFAATHPDRCDGLVLISSYAKRVWSEDYPWAPRPGERQAEWKRIERTWGDPDQLPDWLAPSMATDDAFKHWIAKYFRLSASPRAAAHLLEMNTQIDTTGVLETIQVPTLCLYRTDDQDVNVEEGRWIASQIPNARFVELEGRDHFFTVGDTRPMLAEIGEFMTGSRASVSPERVLATVLFTDIVASTERAEALGDVGWRTLLQRHKAMIRRELRRHRGREIDTAGDGFLATFDGPARAIAAARAICAGAARMDLELRAGLHTGEVELVDDGVAGLAVHIGARIAGMAEPGQILVSRTVKDLVSGSGLEFEDRGIHHLKGVEDEWQVFAVV